MVKHFEQIHSAQLEIIAVIHGELIPLVQPEEVMEVHTEQTLLAPLETIKAIHGELIHSEPQEVAMAQTAELTHSVLFVAISGLKN